MELLRGWLREIRPPNLRIEDPRVRYDQFQQFDFTIALASSSVRMTETYGQLFTLTDGVAIAYCGKKHSPVLVAVQLDNHVADAVQPAGVAGKNFFLGSLNVNLEQINRSRFGDYLRHRNSPNTAAISSLDLPAPLLS